MTKSYLCLSLVFILYFFEIFSKNFKSDLVRVLLFSKYFLIFSSLDLSLKYFDFHMKSKEAKFLQNSFLDLERKSKLISFIF